MATLIKQGVIIMVKCDVCGTELTDDSNFCTTCGAKKCSVCGHFNPKKANSCANCGAVLNSDAASQTVRDNTHQNQKAPSASASRQANSSASTEAIRAIGASAIANAMKNMPSLKTTGAPKIVTAEGEIIVREYYCSELRRPKVSGYLIVTNKRIIFSGQSSNSRLSDEVPIDSAGTIQSYYGSYLRVGQMIAAIVLFFLSMNIINQGQESYFGGGMLTFLGILMLFGSLFLGYLAFRKAYYLSIYSSKAANSVISIGTGSRSNAVLSISGDPTNQTDQMMRELGALILDLQQLGDKAISKWSA